MKIFFFAIGGRDRASSRLRVWDHLAAFRDAGAAVRSGSLMAEGVKGATIGWWLRLLRQTPRWFAHFFWADTVVVQESLLLWPAALLKNFGKKRRLVFDFSDPVDRVGAGLKRRLRQRLFRVFIDRSDVIMVENRAYVARLAQAAGCISHFYGPVDAGRYGAGRSMIVKSDDAPLRIGWTGSPSTYSFIAPLMPIIDDIAKDCPIELVLIGVRSIDYQFRHAKLSLLDWSEDVEFAMVPTFDLGLFRLDGSEDSRWRGAGKLFIYMAAGVPFVSSDIGIAKDLMRESGLGFPVADDQRWFDTLLSATRDDAGRRAVSQGSIAFARDKLAYDVYRQQLACHLGLGRIEKRLTS